MHIICHTAVLWLDDNRPNKSRPDVFLQQQQQRHNPQADFHPKPDAPDGLRFESAAAAAAAAADVVGGPRIGNDHDYHDRCSGDDVGVVL